MKTASITVALVVAVAVPVPALAGQDDTASALPADGQWVLDYGEEHCRLVRAFGAGDTRHILALEQDEPGERFAFTLVGPQAKRFDSNGDIELLFGDVPVATAGTSTLDNRRDIGPMLRLTVSTRPGAWEDGDTANQPRPFAPMDAERFAAANTIHLTQDDAPIVFETGAMSEPLAALNTCALDLVKHWGLDVDEQAGALRRPVWTNQQAFAERMLRNVAVPNRGGATNARFRMRFAVDEAGAVTECFLDGAAKVGNARADPCRFAGMARFEPALDADGRPMASYYIARVLYRGY